MDIPKILMGRENPNGWKLESLLEKIHDEIGHKSEQIGGSDHKQAGMIIDNNSQIRDLLFRAITIQEDTYRQLDAVEPNKGPLNPRL